MRTLCLCNSITAHCVRACGYHATHTIYRVHDDNNDDGNGNDDAKVQRNQLAHGTDQGHNSCVCVTGFQSNLSSIIERHALGMETDEKMSRSARDLSTPSILRDYTQTSGISSLPLRSFVFPSSCLGILPLHSQPQCLKDHLPYQNGVVIEQE
ncbi:PREDICTED: uncharacterized protein LOC105626176 [Atta cephalotes]|uniref:Uncharacterized protein n=1 Tax=Atta cephalotes TaxID=12957 RepID=A0A158NZB8_ATTCE|nr:PREDICTED: uncharacterized protein LOC105626176 [Atta cephalotes]XP_018058529.1 PREDICTED: uncharacterized protein LOC108693871 [Atta colombica]